MGALSSLIEPYVGMPLYGSIYFTMDLLLIRHAEAQALSCSDSDRTLTNKGREQAQKVGDLLCKLALIPDIILTSPLVRAGQTATIMSEVLGAESPITEQWLACGMKPDRAMAELQAYSEFSRVAIVGHEPDFSGLVEWLLATESGSFRVRKASVTLLRGVSAPSRGAEMEMMLPVDVM